MHYVVVGAGYTGQRLEALLPTGKTTALRRADLDLDREAVHRKFPEPFAVLFTVPPSIVDGSDRRIVHLFDAFERPPERFVYLSTTGVYGDAGGREVTEASPTRPSNERGRARLAAEQTAARLCSHTGTALFILRVPGIYGPGRLGLERIEKGEPVIRESEAAPGNRIHVDDLAGCCAGALTGDAPPGIYNLGDGDHRSGTWFAMTVAKLAGLEAPPEISRAEAESVFSESRLSFLRDLRRVDTTKMRGVLRFEPRYLDPEEGIRASL